MDQDVSEEPARGDAALAWELSAPGGSLQLKRVVTPPVRDGAVLVRVCAVPLLSYMADYVAGKLPYAYPGGPFTPGTNGVGVIEAVGSGVFHLKVGQRVTISPHLVANEIANEPAQILIGLTAISPDSGVMQALWPDGTLRELALMPASVLVPLDGLEGLSAERLATLGKFAVPLGGLLRGRFRAGEILVVNGATGYFGSAAVLLGLALGAERVVAAGRSHDVLNEMAKVGGPRVVPIALTGDEQADASALKAASGRNGAHVAFDQVGGASDPAATLAALRSLRRGGRMVLMGSMSAPLPISYGELMINNWELIGNFMYSASVLATLTSLVRSGLLDLDMVKVESFRMRDLPAAMDKATRMRGLDCTILDLNRG